MGQGAAQHKARDHQRPAGQCHTDHTPECTGPGGGVMYCPEPHNAQGRGEEGSGCRAQGAACGVLDVGYGLMSFVVNGEQLA